jgi:hypothetical protein
VSEVHLGFTGSREGCTPIQERVLLQTLGQFRHGDYSGYFDPILWMHNGDCVGADHLAARMWKRMGGKIHGHPPSNPVNRAYFHFDIMEDPKEYGKRDFDIVASSSVMIATPKSYPEVLRSGTWMTVRMARRALRLILIIKPDGNIITECTGRKP